MPIKQYKQAVYKSKCLVLYGQTQKNLKNKCYFYKFLEELFRLWHFSTDIKVLFPSFLPCCTTEPVNAAMKFSMNIFTIRHHSSKGSSVDVFLDTLEASTAEVVLTGFRYSLNQKTTLWGKKCNLKSKRKELF